MQLFIPTIIGILLIGSLNVPSVAGEYLGCFPANNITEPSKMVKNKMTISICSDLCHKSGYEIYGLQYGSHCYCFNNESRSFNKSQADKRLCNTHCKGGPKCGGDHVIAITKLSSSFSGCFNYTPNDTLYFGGKLNELTPKVCRDKCHYFQFFGLTQGSKCYCLSSIPETLRTANASCMKDGVWCVGGERCGGSGFIAIWNYITTEKENDPVTTTALSSSTSIAWSSPGSQDSSNNEGGRKPFAWITIEITEGITWLFVILVIISFILGGVTVIGLVLLIQKYRSHKILMEVRRRLRDTEKRTKVNEREENGSSVEDLSKPKKDIMPNMDSEYSQVNRKAQTKTSVLSSETTPPGMHDNGYDDDDDDVATKSDTKDKDTTRHPTSIQETKVTLNEVNEHGDEENHCSRNGINSSSSTEYNGMKQNETSPLQRNFAGMDNTYAVVDKKTHPKRFDETRL